MVNRGMIVSIMIEKAAAKLPKLWASPKNFIMTETVMPLSEWLQLVPETRTIRVRPFIKKAVPGGAMKRPVALGRPALEELVCEPELSGGGAAGRRGR